MHYTFQTNVGKVRSHNEDSVGVFKNEYGVLAIVADGMGGHLAGDVASSMSVSYFEKKWANVDESFNAKDAEIWLKKQCEDLNKYLYDHAQVNKECQGMGTTIVVTMCTEEFITMAHVGDSRVYINNEFGFTQKTSDHSLVQELVNTGQITEAEAEHHPRKNVLLRALGTETTIKVDVQTLQVEADQVIVLCSDGLSNKVEQDELKAIITGDQPLEAKAEACIVKANERGGEDNISIAIVQYPTEPYKAR
ncbi:Stp1/IreP family PP2C-type Ser/Thr phosphatase [Bacillus sp. FJAT-45037]|uniref:Stp1/IreP family PP2C-type Ser/Thr phosphatase n=1 Tax=Bacillus sp. FJAT-45037 TaxID=2011007 RepID=UPI000C23F551|nr:Stp1/IreP family PP2C-type Ser/Thr phosphatase [Bacillus sp. FJAT-45037]